MSANNIINEAYKKCRTFTEMSEQHQKLFVEIVSYYGPMLEKGVNDSKYIYTMHNFNNHCLNIMKTIGDILIYTKLESDELFLLNLAILFHDMSMTKRGFKRETHSRESKKLLIHEFENGRHPFDNNILSENLIKMTGAIIEAHSDIKDDTIDDNNNGLNNSELNKTYNNNYDLKFIAALLRFADELDITTNRIADIQIEKDLIDLVKEGKASEDEIESSVHLSRLHYFTHINRSESDNTTIVLNCNDTYIQEKITNGEDCSNIIIEIKNICKKLDAELIKANAIFCTMKAQKINSIIKIKVISEIAELQDYLNQSPEDLTSSSAKLTSNDNCGHKISNKNVNENSSGFHSNNDKFSSGKNHINGGPIVLEHCNVEIDEYINLHNLWQDGHYVLNEKYCARDWINTRKILEDKKMSQKCALAFAEFYLGNIRAHYNKAIFVGVDFEGALLASKIALLTQMPFTYIIPVKAEADNASSDVKNIIADQDEIILVIDSISTYETIKSVIEKYKIRDKTVKVFALLYRKPHGVKLEDKSIEYIKKLTVYLNTEHDIEIRKKENCVKKKKMCIKKN